MFRSWLCRCMCKRAEKDESPGCTKPGATQLLTHFSENFILLTRLQHAVDDIYPERSTENSYDICGT